MMKDGKPEVKKTVIEERFKDPVKAAHVLQTLTDSGLWRPDEFFPNDVELRWYIMPEGSVFAELSKQTDSVSLSATSSLSNDSALALLDEGGLLAMSSIGTAGQSSIENVGAAFGSLASGPSSSTARGARPSSSTARSVWPLSPTARGARPSLSTVRG